MEDDGVLAEAEDTGSSNTEESLDNAKAVIEALLFAANEPVPLRKLSEIVDGADSTKILEAIEQLKREYDQQQRAFQIEEIAGGYQILSRPNFSEWIGKLHKAHSDTRLSQAALETLAIVAYRQPILRADMEDIRGVQSGQLLRNLMEKNLVRVVGHADTLGRPLLYGTTKKFLEVFGLKSIDNLPDLDSTSE